MNFLQRLSNSLFGIPKVKPVEKEPEVVITPVVVPEPVKVEVPQQIELKLEEPAPEVTVSINPIVAPKVEVVQPAPAPKKKAAPKKRTTKKKSQ